MTIVFVYKFEWCLSRKLKKFTSVLYKGGTVKYYAKNRFAGKTIMASVFDVFKIKHFFVVKKRTFVGGDDATFLDFCVINLFKYR